MPDYSNIKDLKEWKYEVVFEVKDTNQNEKVYYIYRNGFKYRVKYDRTRFSSFSEVINSVDSLIKDLECYPIGTTKVKNMSDESASWADVISESGLTVTKKNK